MSLIKLFDNGYLKKAEPTAWDINAKFAVADRNLQDAANEDISIDTRFRLSYEAMLVAAQALLLANGYRPASVNNHYYSIESLEHTIGESRDGIILLHALAKKRHVIQYDMAGAISPEELGTMTKQAKRIINLAAAMIAAKHPEFT
jgi:uncharacterized protein (UPF0332 family)